MSTPAFSHSCSTHTHAPGCRPKHAGPGSPGFGVTQPPCPCPELQLSVLSGAHTHAKLAGRVTDWQARHQANQAGHSQEQDREGSRPPSLGREGFLPHPGSQPQDQARLNGSSLRRKSPQGGCWSPGTGLMTQGSKPPQPWPSAGGYPVPLTSPAEAAADGRLLRQGKPSLCPAGWGRSHPDKEFDSSNPVVRQAVGRREGAGSGWAGAYPSLALLWAGGAAKTPPIPRGPSGQKGSAQPGRARRPRR